MRDSQLPVLDATRRRRWRRRRVHVPVAVWIAASVAAGAAIGAALEPSGGGEEVPATTEQVAAACDDNYRGCVPVSTDVDCADEGGGGLAADRDGPSFVTAPVELVGDDVYGLDPDRNGIGCD